LADGIIAGTIMAGTGPDSTGVVMQCAAASVGAVGRAGMAGAVVVAADILAVMAAGEVALPFRAVAPGWVVALLGSVAAVPVVEPAWAAWAGAMEEVTAEAAAVTVEVVATAVVIIEVHNQKPGTAGLL
jgi:hypothetical protein